MKMKQPFHHGSLKLALLDASVVLLDMHGPDGVTIRAVAREAGVSHAAPVNHYKDRETLLTALATVLFKDLLACVIKKLRSEDLLANERISVFAIVLFEYAMTYPNRYRLQFLEGGQGWLVEYGNRIISRQTGKRRRAFEGTELDQSYYRIDTAYFTVPRVISGNRALIVNQHPADLYRQRIQTVRLNVGESNRVPE